MRAVLERLLELLVRTFFRRIEIVGAPTPGPVVYALNHPNALVDPIFILCFAPQRVSFLAKAPVFRMPVIGALVRALDSLPVYRSQDGADPADNRRTLDAAHAILARGGAIALFPEGTSHSDPRLRPLKTGAARIALAANARAGAAAVPVVPVGLHYTAKGRFRSQALVSFGAPLAVERVALDDALEPPAAAVHALTARIEAALVALTLQADSAAALELASRAEAIYSATEGPERAASLADNLALRQRFVAGHAALVRTRPAEVDRVVARIGRYEAYLERLGLDPGHPDPAAFTWRRAARFTGASVLEMALLAPLALLGAALHAPAYQLIRALSFRIAKDGDMPATVKLLGALLLFPLTWLVVGLAGWRQLGPLAGVGLAAAAPLLGYAALIAGQRLARVGSAVRSLWVFATRRHLLGFLADERAAIRAELVRLAGTLDDAPGAAGVQ